jgi:hypothetical protein
MARRRQAISYLDYLYQKDYKERPVDVRTFICHKDFLGNSTGEGKAIYDIWKVKLDQLLHEDSKTLIVLTGAIGTGKTTAAYIGISYTMYRLLCLKNAWEFFDLSDGDKMAIMFFNLTKTLSKSRGFNLLQSFLLKSPWFLNRSSGITGTINQVVTFPLFEYILGSPYSKGFGSIGHHVITAMMDEVDDPNESLNQKLRILKAYENTNRRFESRFIINGESLGRFWLVASKQERLSFLNTFITQMKSSPKVYIVDIAIWDAKPKTNYCGKKFVVLLGDAYTPPKILKDSEITENSSSADKMIFIPVEYKDDFARDIIGALRDIAGISAEGTRIGKLFSSESLLLKCYDKDKPDPVSVHTIETGLDDDKDYISYFDMSKFRTPLSVPRYIHEDIAFSGDGDCVGLGCSHIKSWRNIPIQQPDGHFTYKREKVVETDFAIRFRAKPGDEVPAFKVRKLILDLRSRGLRIKKFSADLRLASADTTQILGNAGVECEYISLDKKMTAYTEFRDLVNDGRWICGIVPILHLELKNLEYDEEKGKIDHPDKFVEIEVLEDGDVKENVLTGSKDVSDGAVGSVINALWDGKPPTDAKIMEQVFERVASKSEHIDDVKQLVGTLTGVPIPKSATAAPTASVSPAQDRFSKMLKKLGKKSNY